MGFLHQLHLLLWKNVSLKRRGPVSNRLMSVLENGFIRSQRSGSRRCRAFARRATRRGWATAGGAEGDGRRWGGSNICITFSPSAAVFIDPTTRFPFFCVYNDSRRGNFDLFTIMCGVYCFLSPLLPCRLNNNTFRELKYRLWQRWPNSCQFYKEKRVFIMSCTANVLFKHVALLPLSVVGPLHLFSVLWKASESDITGSVKILIRMTWLLWLYSE